MINYIKMKKKEWKIKTMFYSILAALADNQKEIAKLLQNMYAALKDVPAEKLQEEFIHKLAEMIHEEGRNKNESL